MKDSYRKLFKDNTLKYLSDYDYFVNTLWKPLMRVEGGGQLHNVSMDSGGWTKYGIAYNKNKHLFESLDDFKQLTESDAQLIGFTLYYINSYTHLVSQDAKDMYFDIAFNMGVGRAIKIAQKVLKLPIDGVLGVVTKSHLKDLKEIDLKNERIKFYYSLVKLKKFLKGWLNRVAIIANID